MPAHPLMIILAGLLLGSCKLAGAPALERPKVYIPKDKHPVPKPTKAIGILNNYPPSDPTQPARMPAFFVRAAGAISAHGDELKVSRVYDTILYEGELVAVVKKRAQAVSLEEAKDFILGYTCGMDGSPEVLDEEGEPDVARSLAGKSADHVAPVGPWVVSGIDPALQEVQLRVNGKVVERSHTRNLTWNPERLVHEVTKTVTLEPGDLIFTGATRAVPQFAPGDFVEVEITDVGILKFHIASEDEK
ncbi:MAG: fumarylacetoacetate hydrolase family protein [Planctomycetes bacterium]|nr:fumarylacetoacetate hydrolase family protein [Planctomycetota bacterium]